MKSSFANREFGWMVVASGLLLAAGRISASDLSLPVTGNLLGVITSATGMPQGGATVQLFNKYEQLVAKTKSDADGRFAFASIPVDIYSVTASLASFLPASKQRISIKPGIGSFLQIHLATLFSDIEVRYVIPTGAMENDWKWVLRSSPSTRPITRLVGDDSSGSKPPLFSETHAILSVSGGEGGLADAGALAGDLGTGFALSTNVLGSNRLRLSGTLNDTASQGPPSMAISAVYSRTDPGFLGTAPEVALTMSQIGGIGSPMAAGSAAGLPVSSGTALRVLSLSFYETLDPTANVHLEYGTSAQSVDYLQPTSRLSPFARVSVGSTKGQLVAAYSDGDEPRALIRHSRDQGPDADSLRDVSLPESNPFGGVPLLSRRQGQLALQRIQDFEFGATRQAGSHTFAASAFHEKVWNGRINVSGDISGLNAGNLFADALSTTSAYNIGQYSRAGYLLSAGQRLGEHANVSLAYGRMGGFTATKLAETNGDIELGLKGQNRNLAALNLKITVPGLGTQFSSDYGWVDSGTIVPQHVFVTQSGYIAPGLNICVRQPLPPMFGWGRIELTANMRNLLAQGYLPFENGQGHQLLMVQAPRAIRGGLNFIF